MSTKPNHPYLDFAQRHSKSPLSTLSAFAALSRMHDLLQDIDELARAIAAYVGAGASRGRRQFWFEITSYYPVGFITCLEWHARSRIADLFAYKPSAARAEDLKGHINDSLLAQSIAAGIAVTHMMGAMTTVGSSEKYITIFDRIFSELGSPDVIRALVNPVILKDEGGKKRDALQSIFDLRNGLAHEISYSTIGPWLVRDAIDIAEAREMGTTVLQAMEAIERKLTQIAPDGFPNRLDSGLSPEDELVYLSRKISDVEDRSTSALRQYRIETGKNGNIDDWLSLVNQLRAVRDAEGDFISNADFLFNRHADFKTPLTIAF
jgi:hypothetical protein